LYRQRLAAYEKGEHHEEPMHKEELIIAAGRALDPEALQRIVARIAARLGANRNDARKAAELLVAEIGDDNLGAQIVAPALDAILATIGASVAEGQAVTVTGFGTFERRTRNPRTGTHPHTGERLQLNPRASVGFRPGRVLRQQVGGPK
jgi:nucleoid DNA-binding protein